MRPTTTLTWTPWVVAALAAATMGCSRDGATETAVDAKAGPSAAALRAAADNTPAENKEIAWALIREDYPQWNRQNQRNCLEQLWFRESRWNHRAVNKRTGACGVPQSYPCNKMKATGQRYGVSYRKNPWPQIAWGLSYIDKRYGSPCSAWKRFQRGGGY
ncbi:MAG: transglycosylase SLT domain-containing protein [Myxococcota bacterium]